MFLRGVAENKFTFRLLKIFLNFAYILKKYILIEKKECITGWPKKSLLIPFYKYM